MNTSRPYAPQHHHLHLVGPVALAVGFLALLMMVPGMAQVPGSGLADPAPLAAPAQVLD